MPDSTINGLTALTGAEVDQTADQFPIWDNSAATTKKITRTQLFSGPVTGDIGSAIRAAASDYAGVAFDGATSNSRVMATLTNQSIGTTDFSAWIRVRVPAATSVNQGVIGFTSSSISLNVSNAFFGYINSSGALAVIKYGATTSDNRIANVSNFTTNYLGQIVDIVITRSGSTLKIYINGVDTTYTEATGGTPPTWDSTVASDYLWVGQSNSPTGILNSSVYRAVYFNRSLSSDDVLDLIEHGVNPADQWGTQTQLINTTTFNGGFETAGAGGADAFANWIEYNAGTSTITRDTTDYSPDLGSTASAKMNGTDATAVGSLYNNGVSAFTAGKRYRIRAAHKRSAAATISWKTATGNAALTSFSVTTSWANYSGEFVMPANDFVKIDFGGASTLWVDNVIYDRIGAIVDLDFTVGIGYQATGRSTNNLHGTLLGTVGWTMPKKKAVLYATTSTATGQQLLGTVAIPTSAYIEAIIVNSDNSGTPTTTLSIGTAASGTSIVNAASISSGRNVLTLAGRFSSNGQLWGTANGTSNLEYTILYTDAA